MKEVFELRTVSKFFDDAVCLSVQRLVFNKKETPFEIFMRLMKKIKHLKSIVIGDLICLSDMLIFQAQFEGI